MVHVVRLVRVERGAREQISRAQNRVQWRANVVDDFREEITLGRDDRIFGADKFRFGFPLDLISRRKTKNPPLRPHPAFASASRVSILWISSQAWRV
jgi:hypothetical protein